MRDLNKKGFKKVFGKLSTVDRRAFGAPLIPFIPLIAAGVSVMGNLMTQPDSPQQQAAPAAAAPAAAAPTPVVPTATTPTVMPTEDSQATLDAKRQALLASTQRGGRASTILSDNSDASSSNNTFGGS